MLRRTLLTLLPLAALLFCLDEGWALLNDGAIRSAGECTCDYYQQTWSAWAMPFWALWLALGAVVHRRRTALGQELEASLLMCGAILGGGLLSHALFITEKYVEWSMCCDTFGWPGCGPEIVF